MMLTQAEADEDLVYQITKVAAESNDALKASFPAFGNVSLEQVAPRNAVPYHPGALRYFEEAGVEVGG